MSYEDTVDFPHKPDSHVKNWCQTDTSTMHGHRGQSRDAGRPHFRTDTALATDSQGKKPLLPTADLKRAQAAELLIGCGRTERGERASVASPCAVVLSPSSCTISPQSAGHEAGEQQPLRL